MQFICNVYAVQIEYKQLSLILKGLWIEFVCVAVFWAYLVFICWSISGVWVQLKCIDKHLHCTDFQFAGMSMCIIICLTVCKCQIGTSQLLTFPAIIMLLLSHVRLYSHMWKITSDRNYPLVVFLQLLWLSKNEKTAIISKILFCYSKQADVDYVCLRNTCT